MRQASLLLRFGILLVSGVLIADSLAEAANWPRFRGPNGAGVATDKDVPIQWTEKNILWKTPIAGKGMSSPVIWEDKLFLQSASNDGKERMLICVNVPDGKVLWTKAEPGTAHKTHAKNSLASSTPATDGERVYCCFWDGKDVGVSAYDFKGSRLWNHILGSYKSEHGVGTSPMVWQDRVFVLNDMVGKCEIVALDAKTGQVAWQAPRGEFEQPSYSTPFMYEKTPGNPQVIVGSSAGVTSYDPKNGGVNWNWGWKFDGKTVRTVQSPIESQGLIFLGGGDGAGTRAFVAVKAEGKGDVTKTNLAWKSNNKGGMPYVPSLLAKDDHLYCVNDNGIAYCFDAKTGKESWNQRLPGGGLVFSSPILVNGNVYIIREDGNAIVFAADPKAYKELGRSQIPEPVLASPAVVDNKLYVRGLNNLYCIGKK